MSEDLGEYTFEVRSVQSFVSRYRRPRWFWAVLWRLRHPLVATLGECFICWGSHGCNRHVGHWGGHRCACCACHRHPDPESGCVGRPPYYGPETRFYGKDAP